MYPLDPPRSKLERGLRVLIPTIDCAWYDVLIPVPALVYTISGLGTELSVVPGANTIVLPVLVPTPTKVTSP